MKATILDLLLGAHAALEDTTDAELPAVQVALEDMAEAGEFEEVSP